MATHILTDPSAAHHFFCSSGGNAGLACATAARAFGQPATIVVPTSTKPLMLAKLRAAGADRIVQIGASWADADRHMREVEMAATPGAVYVPPFDDPRVWEGHATMVDEVKEQLRAIDAGQGDVEGRPDAVVCSVGGGGLFCGVMQGLEQNFPNAQYHRSDSGADGARRQEPVRVLAIETQGADSLAASLGAGEHVRLPGITSIATSLGATKVAPRAFELAAHRRDVVRSVVLRDAEAAMGCWRLADDERLLVEASCGASVAMCYGGRLRQHLPDLREESRVVVVVCGGSNVTLEMLVEYRRTYGKDKDVLSDVRTEQEELNGIVPS